MPLLELYILVVVDAISVDGGHNTGCDRYQRESIRPFGETKIPTVLDRVIRHVEIDKAYDATSVFKNKCTQHISLSSHISGTPFILYIHF
jgi:hypothetical protein